MRAGSESVPSHDKKGPTARQRVTHTLTHTYTHLHTHTRTRTHGYLGSLVDVGPLGEQQPGDLEVAVLGGNDEAGQPVLKTHTRA